MNVSIYEAKTRFSELIALVEQGQELVVSRRNRKGVSPTQGSQGVSPTH